MQLLSPGQLLHLDDLDQIKYTAALERFMAVRTVLDVATAINPHTQRFPHAVMLDHHLVALAEGRLYHDGPGPLPVLCVDTGEYTHPADVGEDEESRRLVVYRLAISMPPRHGKSYMVSEFFPVWYLNRWPDRKIILASYSDDKAAEWGGKARDHMVEGIRIGILDVNVKGGENAGASDWGIEGHTGGLRCKGTGGAITGSGGHLRIIDDPIKDEEQANSPRQREKLADWYDSVYSTRAEAIEFESGDIQQGVEVMMFTRWHEADLAGTNVFKHESDEVEEGWCLLNLPALANEDDPLDRKPAEPLCPRLVTEKFLIGVQSKNPHVFAALYQGNPVTKGSGILAGPYPTFLVRDKYLELDDGERVPRDTLVRFATMDTALTKNTWSDYTVFAVWAMDREHRLYLMDRERIRILGPEHKTHLRAWWDAHNVLAVGIEDAGDGKRTLQEMAADESMRDIIIVPLLATGDKVSRAVPYGIELRERKCFFRGDAPWLASWMNEHAKFPHAGHDDQVDTGAYARKMANNVTATKVRKPGPQNYDERVWEAAERRITRKERGPSVWDSL